MYLVLPWASTTYLNAPIKPLWRDRAAADATLGAASTMAAYRADGNQVIGNTPTTGYEPFPEEILETLPVILGGAGCILVAAATMLLGLQLTVNLMGDALCLLLPTTFYKKRTPRLWSAFLWSLWQFGGYFAGAIAVLGVPALNHPVVVQLFSLVSAAVATHTACFTVLRWLRNWGSHPADCSDNNAGYRECANSNGGGRGRRRDYRQSYR